MSFVVLDWSSFLREAWILLCLDPDDLFLGLASFQADSIVFSVLQPPRHGTIERTSNGQHFRQTGSFTMDDVYQNRISYNHDGSNSLKDRFSFTVADGTNLLFMVEEGGKEVRAALSPQVGPRRLICFNHHTPPQPLLPSAHHACGVCSSAIRVIRYVSDREPVDTVITSEQEPHPAPSVTFI